MLAWNELEARIQSARNILLTTHVRPDGDALGSELAMARLLEQKGKSVEILNSSPTPPRYRFMDPDGTLFNWIGQGTPWPAREPDLFIVLDTGTWSQLAGLADYVRQLTIPKVVIDHHKSQDDLGALRLVDASAAASGILVYRAYEALGGTISAEAAQAMFIAIAMDTGWMRHPNASGEVFTTLARLVDAGAQPHRVYRELFERNRLQRLQLMRALYDHIELRSDGRLAIASVRWHEIMDVGAHPMETEDFINELMSLDGVEVAALFIGQAEGGTKVSFRSRCGFDCSRFAERFGGGGHAAAAGASFADPPESVLPKVSAQLEEELAR